MTEKETPSIRVLERAGSGIFEAKTNGSVTDGTAGAIKLSVSQTPENEL